MRKRKKRSHKKLDREGRIEDARKWLRSGNRSRRPLLEAYTRRYGVSETVAWEELAALGCYDQLTIEAYEREGIEWEHRVEPLSGDMFVVPKGIEDYELYLIHPII
ncbi:MAG: hypothetical protein RBS80_31985 [Thermoguttaceae bacterium]|nr:hypothetical protein [Thermoguttaceae bacterium]